MCLKTFASLYKNKSADLHHVYFLQHFVLKRFSFVIITGPGYKSSLLQVYATSYARVKQAMVRKKPVSKQTEWKAFEDTLLQRNILN